MSEDPIPYHRPSFSDRELEAVGESLRSGQVAGPGRFCRRVESALQERWPTSRALTVSSCTHALELALLAMDLDGEDEVVVPSFTYVSTALAVLRAGAVPVFADVDPGTLTLTPRTLEPVLTERTRAVIMVHYGGFPGPVDELVSFCGRNQLDCVEDAAQCFGARWKDRPAGTFGRFGAFSFHGTKSLSCGEGGLLLVNNPDDVRRCEMIRDKGTDRSVRRRGDVDRYTWRTIGSSYVLSDLQGAVLWQQLERWPRIRERRLEVQSRVREMVRAVDSRGMFELITPPEAAQENGHLTAFRVPWGDAARNWFLRALQAEGVQAREHYHPLHESPYAREYLRAPEPLPVSERVASSLVRIPAHPELSRADLGTIREALEKVYPHLPPDLSGADEGV